MNTDAANRVVLHYALNMARVWCGAAIHPRVTNDPLRVTCRDCRRRMAG